MKNHKILIIVLAIVLLLGTADVIASKKKAVPEETQRYAAAESSVTEAETETETAAETTAPETTEAETTAAGTTEAETTAVETTEAETTAAGTTEAETTAVETTEAETTAAETTEPETTVPETTAALKNGLIKKNGSVYYYIDDVRQTGWQTVDGNRYYFGNDGKAFVGLKTIGGTTYCFDDNGAMRKNTVWDRYAIDGNGVCTDRFRRITEDNLAAYVDYLLDHNGRSLQGAFDYIWKNFIYRYAARIGTLEGMTEADRLAMICRFLNNGFGPCTDFAYTLQYFCQRLGYEARVVTGTGLYHSEHDWVLVQVRAGTWRHMDALYKSVYLYLKTDDELAALDGPYYSFQWNRNKWTSTTSTGTKP